MPSPKRQVLPNFGKSAAEFQRLKDNLLLYAGNEAVNFFKDGFTRKGFIDKGNKPWKERKKTKGKKKPKGTLMNVSGRLKNSIRVTNRNIDTVAIGTDVPYAEVHNEGSREYIRVMGYTRTASKKVKVQGPLRKGGKRTKVKTKGVTHKVKTYEYRQNIPIRQFIGESDLLMRRLEKNLENTLDNFIDNL